MANKLYNEDSIRAIASAIRSKNGTENTYNVSEMAEAIQAIVTGSGEGGITPTGSIEITSNGTYDVTNYASAIVNVLTGGDGEPMTFGSLRAGIYIPEETIGFATLPNTKPGTSLVIEHGLGIVPDVAFLLNITPADTLVAPALILSGKTPTCDLAICYRTADLASTNVVSAEGKYCVADETTVTFAGNGSSTYVMNPGQTYLWIVASEEYSDGSGAPTEGVSIGPWHTGTFSVEESLAGTEFVTVNHNLGFTPSIMVVWADEYADTQIYSGAALVGGNRTGSTQGGVRKADGTITYNATCPIQNITDTTFDFGGMSATYKIVAGWTYRWFAMA